MGQLPPSNLQLCLFLQVYKSSVINTKANKRWMLFTQRCKVLFLRMVYKIYVDNCDCCDSSK